MTDNRNDSQNTERTLTQTVSPNDLNVEQTTADSSSTTDTTDKPQMKKVDIVITGVTYQIYCPIHEEEELRSAVYYINNFAVDIKKDAPNINQENLLLLCCLNLYETINTNKKSDNSRHQENKKTEALLSKIMRDAHSIL